MIAGSFYFQWNRCRKDNQTKYSDGLRDATFNAGSGFTSSIVYNRPASRW
jgi:hypothetical protein